MALVDVQRAYFYAPSRRRVSFELPPEDCPAGDEHMCGLLRYSLCGTRDAAQNWEEELASTLSYLKLTRGTACPCVWQGCIEGEHVLATVHGDDITIGGERVAVEFFANMTSRTNEMKEQVRGEDAHLEKNARIFEPCHQVRPRRHHDRGGSETCRRDIEGILTWNERITQ